MDLIRSARAPRPYLVGFGLATAVGLLLFGYRYLDRVLAGRQPSPLGPLIDEVGAAWAAAAFLPIAIALVRRYPLDRRGWASNIPIHLAGVLAFAAYHTTAMWTTRSVVYPLAGLGSYHFGPMPTRYLMELPLQVVGFSIVIALIHLYDRNRAAQQRELQISQLETELVRARLDALRMQLNPHFLFNTLNTVSAVMYEDLDTADDMLARLCELLRRTMYGAEQHEVPLREELETLDLYLSIMRARFADRLDVQIDAAPDTLEARVPAMLLQPLVENALEHGGMDAADSTLVVRVVAERVGDRLRLEVRDLGRGAAGEAVRPGIGLGNTTERLRKLYGEQQRLDVASTAGGGFTVRVEIPLRVRDAPLDQEDRAVQGTELASGR
jgi:two-component system, LytTR family, sensor kinase